MLIYLNRTGFNGLFRLNARGGFNVPADRYTKPAIGRTEPLVRVAEALANPRLELLYGSFDTARDIAAAGDFLYCDPPYAPLTATSSFTTYTASAFGLADHARL
jgi:DNA adenine methylase